MQNEVSFNLKETGFDEIDTIPPIDSNICRIKRNSELS